MLGVLEGAAIIAIVIAVGYLVAVLRVFPAGTEQVLNRFAFLVATPAIIFRVVSMADLRVVFSSYMAVAAICAAVCAAMFVGASMLAFRRPLAETVVGAAASIYANSTNMGIPVATYVIGDPSAVAATLVLQSVVIGPLVVTLLQSATQGRISARSVLLQPLRTPLVPAAALGALVAVFHVPIPDVVMEPIAMLGAASIPVVLIAFGMSLRSERPLAAPGRRIDVLVATAIKAVAMPTVAFVVARFALGLDASTVFAVTIVAALPTGQIVYNYAAHYERAVTVARDVIILSTGAALPIMLAAALLLAPAAG